ncbi:MAG: hypothetical protein Q9171_005376 [Xanthocarpia ochracea]
MTTNLPEISLRPPTTSTHLPQPPSFTAPTPAWLSGTWHVTHSTLPMWKSKRNVCITYTPLPAPSSPSSPPNLPQIEDLVTYQTLTSPKLKKVVGIDTPSPGGTRGGEWDWRGKGLLKIASSHWEVLGWGDLPPAAAAEGQQGEGEGEGNQWVVTYFAKTLFTPAGIDVYSRRKEGVGKGVVERIREELGGCEDDAVRKLAGEVFEVKKD